MGLQIGAELGVQKGEFASNTLEKWKSVKSYHLIDLWSAQKNYKDLANNMDHDQNYRETLSRMKAFRDRGVEIKVCRNLTSRHHSHKMEKMLNTTLCKLEHSVVNDPVFYI